MKSISKYTVLLVAILLVAAALRLFKLSTIPPALSWDEVSIGYDAWSVLKTGKDQWGEILPLAFKSFGEYKYPLHIYTAAVSMAIFGYGEFAVRAGSAILGIINIYLLYLFVVEATKNKKLGILSALFLAISPWHIQFSRVSWETNYALFFLYLGLLLFFKFINNNKRKHFLVGSFILFGITLFTYNAAKVFIPPFLLSLIVIYRKNLLTNKLLVVFSSCLFALFLLLNVINPKLSGVERYNQLGFIESQVVETYSYKATRVYKLGWAETAVRQYFEHFTPSYLFISGDPNPRHSIQSVGQLYWFDLLFIPLGFYVLFKKRGKFSVFLSIWFFLAILPASIAREVPHASRTMMALGSWQIVSAFGALFLLESKLFKKYTFLKLILFLGIAIGVVYYVYNYFVVYPTTYSKYWQYGYKQAVEYVGSNYNNYDLIVISRKYGEPQIFTLFYLKYPPGKYQNDTSLTRDKEGDWIKVTRFDKFRFVDFDTDHEVFLKLLNDNNDKNTLVVGVPGEIPDEIERIKKINFLDGTTAFEIVKI